MRTGAAAGHHGHLHEALLYSSERELLDVAIPFLRDGVAAGEPTVVGLGAANADRLRAQLPDESLRYLPGDAMYARPASAIAAYRRLLREFVDSGAQQVRIIGELAPADFGDTWHWWARYESAVNELYDEFPLWSMCAYDTRTTPAHVLDDVGRTHPSIAGPHDRRVPSMLYVPPPAFLTAPAPPDVDPLQAETPLVHLTDVRLADFRGAVDIANTVALPADTVDHLKVAVNEVVTNAMRHGDPPVEVRYWAGDGRMIVAVSNKGAAPEDPYLGLRPAAHAPNGGLGLWLVHQLCDNVRLHRGADGFTVTLTVAAPS